MSCVVCKPKGAVERPCGGIVVSSSGGSGRRMVSMPLGPITDSSAAPGLPRTPIVFPTEKGFLHLIESLFLQVYDIPTATALAV